MIPSLDPKKGHEAKKQAPETRKAARRGRPLQMDPETRHAQIVKAAKLLLHSRPFDDVHMSAIANAAGMSKRTCEGLREELSWSTSNGEIQLPESDIKLAADCYSSTGFPVRMLSSAARQTASERTASCM